MTCEVSDQVPVQFSCEALKLTRLFYRSIPIGIDLLERKIKADMTSICGEMYLYQATKFALQLKNQLRTRLHLLRHFFVLTTFDVIFDLITEQKHGKMESICFNVRTNTHAKRDR